MTQCVSVPSGRRPEGPEMVLALAPYRRKALFGRPMTAEADGSVGHDRRAPPCRGQAMTY